MIMHTDLYLDYNGSTPVDDAVADQCARWMSRGFGNAAAAHPEGQRARDAIDRARTIIAATIGASADEIWFTSGGTESNNWALIGAVARSGGAVAVSSIEHKSVLKTAEHLASGGTRVSILPVSEDGTLELDRLDAALDADVRVVSVMLANNETGVIQPIAEVASRCRARGVALHSDAVCAIGKVPVDVRVIGCDLLSLSAHKLYAPKGVGVLYVRRGFDLAPLIHGCGQQSGMRSGSENTSGVVAFGTAFERMAAGAFQPAEPLDRLRDRLWAGIRGRIPAAVRNGAAPFLPNTLSVAFPGELGATLQAAFGRRGVSVAAGAAAATGAPSHVLKAMGCTDERARSTLRFSLGRFTTQATIDACLAALDEILASRTPTGARA